MTADEIVAAVRANPRFSTIMEPSDVRALVAEIVRLRSERGKFEMAWDDVSTRYEALLNQLGGTDA